jgi:hypothetical protein
VTLCDRFNMLAFPPSRARHKPGRIAHCRSSNEKPSDIGVALLRYPTEPLFAAGGILTWC